MKHIPLLDTSVASDNIGDEIIVEAVRQHLLPLLADCYVTSSSTHDGMGACGRRLAAQADVIFLLGTNALSARYRVGRPAAWSLARADLAALEGRVVLVGVGANGTFDGIQWRQKRLLRRLLARDVMHSVRDQSAVSLLEAAGLRAVNTSCPTLWRWGGGRSFDLGGRKGAVCFSLTAYKAHATDAVMVGILRDIYPRLLFWPQMKADADYVKRLGVGEVEMVTPNLAAYDRVLADPDLDVIGSRLHGGIRALAQGRRTLVIEVDNRAREIGRHTGLPTMARDAMADRLQSWIATPTRFTLTLPEAARDAFLAQFRGLGARSAMPC